MKNLRKKVYMTAGYNTISLGTGRKEFNPKKSRPGIDHYILEAGREVLGNIGGGSNVDECVMGNFMAARFNRQANLPGFFPMIDGSLRYKPATSVEGACASGGLALTTSIKSVLAETADVVLALGVEVQNTMKAIYGADVLAAAGYFPKRKDGHAYFFPGQFSNRAGAYFQRYGKEKARMAMATWYKNMIENARLCPTAQEYHNTAPNLFEMGMMEPNPRSFVDHLNVFDCSKVSDGSSAIIVASEEGLAKLGIGLEDTVEIVAWAQLEDDISKEPDDLTVLSTIRETAKLALERAGIGMDKIGTVETHDCFTIAAVLAIEALGLAAPGKGPEYILEGNTARGGELPFNTTGGLIGWGHPTGATGVHQAVTIWEQLTGKAGDAQITINEDRPYGMTINMGGDDKTVVAIVYKKP